jgi:cytochrome oxidase Cu insertion factor (SCO1/SenC/PrrC family)
MKTTKIIFAVLFTLLSGGIVSAQTQAQKNTTQTAAKTETFKVWGACEMCKTRIEKTVKAEGVTTANWDEKTQMLTVSFDPKKSSVDVLSKKLASVGHDTEKYRAPDEVYAKLPGCCHYDRAK